MHFEHWANTLLEDEKSARDNYVFACNFAKYSPILIFFTLRLNNKPFLIWFPLLAILSPLIYFPFHAVIPEIQSKGVESVEMSAVSTCQINFFRA